MIVKIDKVLKTKDGWKPQGSDKEMFVSLIKTFDSKKFWTFSGKFEEGTEMDVDITESKRFVRTPKGDVTDKKGDKGFWVDQKINPVKVDFEKGGKSPEVQKNIIRQHSQEMALLFLNTQAMLRQIEEVSFSDVQSLTDMFESDVQVTPKKLVESKSKGKDDTTAELDLDSIPF